MLFNGHHFLNTFHILHTCSVNRVYGGLQNIWGWSVSAAGGVWVEYFYLYVYVYSSKSCISHNMRMAVVEFYLLDNSTTIVSFLTKCNVFYVDACFVMLLQIQFSSFSVTKIKFALILILYILIF